MDGQTTDNIYSYFFQKKEKKLLKTTIELNYNRFFEIITTLGFSPQITI